MKIPKCLNCYKEIITDNQGSYCVNTKCFRYGLMTRRVFSSGDSFAGFSPRIEIDYERLQPKTEVK